MSINFSSPFLHPTLRAKYKEAFLAQMLVEDATKKVPCAVNFQSQERANRFKKSMQTAVGHDILIGEGRRPLPIVMTSASTHVDTGSVVAPYKYDGSTYTIRLIGANDTSTSYEVRGKPVNTVPRADVEAGLDKLSDIMLVQQLLMLGVKVEEIV